MTKPANCWCCGSRGEVDKFTTDTWTYTCSNLDDCGVCGPSAKTPELALAAWNKLMAPAEKKAEVPSGYTRVVIPIGEPRDWDGAPTWLCYPVSITVDVFISEEVKGEGRKEKPND